MSAITAANHNINATTMANTTDQPGFYEKDVGVRIVSGSSSALSIIGSALIIFSYICFRSLRTRARLILVHLALTDMGVGISNLVGILVNFDHYYKIHHSSKVDVSIDVVCKTQAFTAEYFTLASVLWTVSLAVYMYLLMSQNQRHLRAFLWLSYAFCYGIPLLVTGWLMATERLGYSPYDSSGWCSIIVTKPFIKYDNKDYMSAIFGYDLWIILTIVLIIVLYTSVYSYVKIRYKELKDDPDAMVYWKAMYNMDYKFIAIPLMFVFLRMWTLIQSILFVYIQLKPDDIAPWLLKALLYLGGMGDSGQGFINGILFVVFTQNVRKRIILQISCMCCQCTKCKGHGKVNHEDRLVQHLKTNSQPRMSFKSSDPIAYESKKYSALPQGEQMNSVTSGINSKSRSLTVSDYFPVSFK